MLFYLHHWELLASCPLRSIDQDRPAQQSSHILAVGERDQDQDQKQDQDIKQGIKQGIVATIERRAGCGAGRAAGRAGWITMEQFFSSLPPTWRYAD